MMRYVNKIKQVDNSTWESADDWDDSMQERDVHDSGKKVDVMELVGAEYSSGQQVRMRDCTLWQDAEGNNYTDWDGISDED